MNDAATSNNVMPSATIDEAELAAWHALPRDEQVRRYRQVLSSQDCDTVTGTSMSDVLVMARRRAAAHRPG